ncbi:MAG: hypothetical protein AAF581_06660 [Planctomycetota bacterium]
MKSRHEDNVRELLRPVSSQPREADAKTAQQLTRQVDPTRADFAIVTALPLELAAILKHFPTLHKVTVGSDSPTYYQAVVVAADSTTKYRVVAALLPCMGNVQAAATTANVISTWNPRFIVMCGIAGGLQADSQQLGDLVVATDVIYCELGKLTEVGLERRPVSYPADPRLVDRARHLELSEWRARLPERPDEQPVVTGFPAVHFAPVASGDKVIASASDAHSLRSVHPRLAAVEMEGAGVAANALTKAGQVGFFMVRSICDFADSAKNDAWQQYSAEAAASFLRALLESRPFGPSQGEWTVEPFEVGAISSSWVREEFFPKLAQSISMDELRDLCFVLAVDVDNLPGATTRAKMQELLLRAEKQNRLHDIVKAYRRLFDGY